MLPDSIIDQIHELLEQGASQRKISRQLRVSRATVRAVQRGTRTAGQRRKPPTFIAPSHRQRFDAKPKLTDLEPFDHDEPPQRCPGCGAMVYMPCVACDARQVIALHKRLGVLAPAMPIEDLPLAG